MASLGMMHSTYERQPRSVENFTLQYAEATVKNTARMHIVNALVEMGYRREDCIYAATKCSSVGSAVNYMEQQCEHCGSVFPDHNMIDMRRCDHRLCEYCIRSHFLKVLNHSSPDMRKMVCPICSQPNEKDAKHFVDYLNELGPMLNELLDKKVYNKFCNARLTFEKKLPKKLNTEVFKYCIFCSSQFTCQKTETESRVVCTRCKNYAYSKDFLDELKKTQMLLPENADIIFQLIEMSYTNDDAILAVKNCDNLDSAVAFLNQDCGICMEKFAAIDMIQLLSCKHRCCRNCAKNHFTVKIKENPITELRCPFCNQPDVLKDPEDVIDTYFSNMDILLKTLVDQETHDIYQTKMRDKFLMTEPNFRWCNKCNFGFIADERDQTAVCSECGAETCFRCRLPWDKKHLDLNCAQFADWHRRNGRRIHGGGLDTYLDVHGIECPNCRHKFDLARGGCLHSTCMLCKHEFCVVCKQQFFRGGACRVSRDCGKMGLHAHHPRNCLSYLSEKEPDQLRRMLQNAGVDVELDERVANRICNVRIQKEVRPNVFRDQVCGEQTERKHAGFCRRHYIEYLADLINKHNVDPVYFLDVDDLKRELQRGGKQIPRREPGENYKDYRNHLIKTVKKEMPLIHVG